MLAYLVQYPCLFYTFPSSWQSSCAVSTFTTHPRHRLSSSPIFFHVSTWSTLCLPDLPTPSHVPFFSIHAPLMHLVLMPPMYAFTCFVPFCSCIAHVVFSVAPKSFFLSLPTLRTIPRPFSVGAVVTCIFFFFWLPVPKWILMLLFFLSHPRPFTLQDVSMPPLFAQVICSSLYGPFAVLSRGRPSLFVLWPQIIFLFPSTHTYHGSLFPFFAHAICTTL